MAFNIILFCTCRIKRQVELVLPAEFKAGAAHGVVTYLCAGMTLCNIRGMCCYLVGYNTVAYILKIWERKVFLGCDIAYHGGAHPGNLCSAYGRCYMVISGSDICSERA